MCWRRGAGALHAWRQCGRGAVGGPSLRAAITTLSPRTPTATSTPAHSSAWRVVQQLSGRREGGGIHRGELPPDAHTRTRTLLPAADADACATGGSSGGGCGWGRAPPVQSASLTLDQ